MCTANKWNVRCIWYYIIYKCIYYIRNMFIALYCNVLHCIVPIVSSVDFYCLLYCPLPTVFLLYSSFISVSFSIACSVAEESVWSFYCFASSQEWLAKCISRKPKRLQKCQEIRKVPNVKRNTEFLLGQWLVWTNLLVWALSSHIIKVRIGFSWPASFCS